MGYQEMWKVLADLLTELRKNDETIPTDVMKDLRSAKTMIQVLKADQNRVENISRIENYLRNVEAYAFFKAREKLGKKFVERWLVELEKAKKLKEKPKVSPRFVPGLPRDKDWIRVRISEYTSKEDVKRLSKENKLLYRLQKNGHILIYGDGEKIRSFINSLRERRGHEDRNTN